MITRHTITERTAGGTDAPDDHQVQVGPGCACHWRNSSGMPAKQGFDGTEIHLPSLHATPEECIALHEKYGLAFVAMITTEGKTAEEHCRSLEDRYRTAVRYRPMLVNCHTGRDIFTLEENLRIFRTGIALEEEGGHHDLSRNTSRTGDVQRASHACDPCSTSRPADQCGFLSLVLRARIAAARPGRDHGRSRSTIPATFMHASDTWRDRR